MVLTYSPHRMHGGPITSSSEQRGTPKRHLSDRVPRVSPLSGTTPFSLSVKPHIQHTPSRTRSGSPFKLALQVASENSLNCSSSPCSSPEMEGSPIGKHTAARLTRSGLSIEHTSSPVRKRETSHGLDTGSIRSPKAKRRSQFGIQGSSSPPLEPSSPVTRSSANGILNTGLSHTPKRSSSLKKVVNTHTFEKPLFPRSSRLKQPKQPEFALANHNNNNTKTLRKMTSFDHFLQKPESPFTGKPLINPSIHLSQNNITLQNSQFANPHPLSRSETSPSSGSQGTQTSFVTPQNYKTVRPLQVAFMSTGLLSKRNRPITTEIGHPQLPDTPCKTFTTTKPLLSARKGFVIPDTPLPGARKGRLSLIRRDSNVSVDEYDFHKINSQESIESADFPPTPTRRPTAPGSARSFGGMASATRSKRRAGDGSPSSRGTRNAFATPRTPHDNNLFPDPSSLSISGKPSAPRFLPTTANAPQTPTAAHDYSHPFGAHADEHSPSETRQNSSFNQTMTPVLNRTSTSFSKEWDFCLENKFSKVERVGAGEFSVVFQVTERMPTSPFAQQRVNGQLGTPSHSSSFGSTPKRSPTPPPQVFAVKRIGYNGIRDREQRVEEASILKAVGKHDHTIEYIDSWEDNMRLYIQTEFCELGGLDVFLSDYGNRGRLDPFRIWKMLADVSSGLQHVHSQGFIHLDLKPANVLITFNGSLKLGDFGMATSWPAQKHLEREGDREYIAPEIIRHQAYDKPADIFSLGLMLLEIAGNVQLPDNGASWQKLREGDKSEWPDMTSGALCGGPRDEYGFPIVSVQDELSLSDLDEASFGSVESYSSANPARLSQIFSNPFLGNPHFLRHGTAELAQPPSFMEEDALEFMVSRLISPSPTERFTAAQIHNTKQVQWVMSRRQAGAVVYEGEWGPSNELEDSLDMMECSQHSQGVRIGQDGEDWIMLEE